MGGVFRSNTARAAGGAIVTSSSVIFSITGTTFTNNGNLNCYEPPLVSMHTPRAHTGADVGGGEACDVSRTYLFWSGII